MDTRGAGGAYLQIDCGGRSERRRDLTGDCGHRARPDQPHASPVRVVGKVHAAKPGEGLRVVHRDGTEALRPIVRVARSE